MVKTFKILIQKFINFKFDLTLETILFNSNNPNFIEMTKDEVTLLKGETSSLDIKAIQKLFENISRMIKGQTLPEFYCVDHMAISFNMLQNDRYPEKKFRYCFTEWKDEIIF